MLSRPILILGLLVLLTGCAEPYRTKPLPTDHPANPRAQTAPQPAASETLAYDQPIEAPTPATMPDHDMHMEQEESHDGAMPHDQHQQHE